MQFVEHLLLESQIRGKHATGYSYVAADDTKVDQDEVVTFKAPVCASEFIEMDPWLAFKLLKPRQAILHTRYSTSGDWQENDNNQPISTSTLALVHNGLVSMATQEDFQQTYKVNTQTANDSEIILRKVLHAKSKLESTDITDEGPGVMAEAIAKALRAIHRVDPPIFACGFLDAEGNVYAVRDHIRPLWFVYIKAWGFIGFASTRDIITRACKKSCVTEDLGLVVWEAEPYTVYPLGRTITSDSVRLSFSYPKEFRFERPSLVYKQWLQNKKHTHNRSDLRLDNGKTRDYRQDLRTAFKHYSVAAITSWEIDPNYVLLNYIFQRYEFSKSQEYWACWLYGVFYHPGTLFWFMQEFPEFEKVDLGRLERWHAANWRKLRYNTDRKYEKGHLVEMFVSYRDLVGGQHPEAQEQFFSQLLDGGLEPTANFHRVFNALKKLVRFGRYATYIYTEALARCMGMPIQADTVFLKEAGSPRAGLCYATNRPDWAKAKLTKEQWAELDAELDTFMQEIQQEYPDVPVDHWLMESCLCAFKGMWRQTKGRYLGYYLDRQADEILQLEEGESDSTSGIDWRVLWQFRRESLMWELLGEYANPPRLKVQKSMEHVMRDTGHMIGLNPFVKRGIIPGESVYSNSRRERQ